MGGFHIRKGKSNIPIPSTRENEGQGDQGSPNDFMTAFEDEESYTTGWLSVDEYIDREWPMWGDLLVENIYKWKSSKGDLSFMIILPPHAYLFITMDIKNGMINISRYRTLYPRFSILEPPVFIGVKKLRSIINALMELSEKHRKHTIGHNAEPTTLVLSTDLMIHQPPPGGFDVLGYEITF